MKTARAAAGTLSSAAPRGENGSAFEANRTRIVRTSAELFARYGYHGTGVSELSKAVGLGKGALYHYIGSKEAILYEISHGQVTRMNELAERLTNETPDPVERLHGLARSLMRNIAEHRAEWTVFFREYHALNGEWRDNVVAARERYEGYWRAAIEQGIRDDALRPQPDLIVKGLLGMFNYSYLWLDPRGGTSPEKVADEFLDAVLDGLRQR